MMNLEERAKAFRREFESSKEVAKSYLKAVDMSEDDLSKIISLYDEWAVGIAVSVGERYQKDGKLYEVVQAHTTQADWTPDKVPALFKEVTPSKDESGTEIVPEWKQPTGAHDAYKKGDKVTFKGKTYESLIDANVYSPSDYPQGWKEI